MGFFDKRKIARHKAIVTAMAEEALGETERTYQGQLKALGREFRPVVPSPKGICASRLFTSAFVAWPFRARWPNKTEDVDEVLNALSGLAVYPHTLPDADYPLHLNDSIKNFCRDYFWTCIRAIDSEVEHGPSRHGRGEVSPSALDAYAKTFGLSNERRAALVEAVGSAPDEAYRTEGFRELELMWLKSLELSAGEFQELERERIAAIVSSTVYSNLSLLGKVAELL